MSAERYNMPSLRLTPEATELLEAYRWPGNIRELRNFTDRISVLEEERLVTAEMVRKYLPKTPSADYHPALRASAATGGEGSSFANEREILYQILFDMKKDMAEMKSLVAGIMRGEVKIPSTSAHGEYTPGELHPSLTAAVLPREESFPSVSTIAEDYTHTEEITDMPEQRVDPHLPRAEELEYEEQPLSLEDIERNVIIAALARHDGRRRPAAEDLKISERTLYRKIKEYGLDAE